MSEQRFWTPFGRRDYIIAEIRRASGNRFSVAYRALCKAATKARSEHLALADVLREIEASRPSIEQETGG